MSFIIFNETYSIWVGMVVGRSEQAQILVKVKIKTLEIKLSKQFLPSVEYLIYWNEQPVDYLYFQCTVWTVS